MPKLYSETAGYQYADNFSFGIEFKQCRCLKASAPDTFQIVDLEDDDATLSVFRFGNVFVGFQFGGCLLVR